MNLEQEIRAGKIVGGMNFNQKVWALTARIPRGRVTTYGELARALGSNGFRAVGNAMNKNPYAPGVPCHRVVGSDGKLTGFAGGLPKKRAMLIREGVRIDARDRADLACMFHFEPEEALAAL
jgi:methylated-DNA-[protein]-cysteine S-methyltransferase